MHDPEFGVEIDEEGYLIDPAQWSEELAEKLAARADVALTDDHWCIVRFMRDYYEEHAVPADARFAIRFIAETLGKGSGAKDYLFELFPYGYVGQACRIAGMRKPRVWSTG